MLGLWAGEHGDGEGAKYWLRVLTEINNRGVGDVCMLVCDGLKHLPDAVAQVWPQTVVQACIVHYADLRIMPMWLVFPLREGDLVGLGGDLHLAVAGVGVSGDVPQRLA